MAEHIRASLSGVFQSRSLPAVVVCDVSWLARFNLTAEQSTDDRGKVKYFERFPTPTILVIAAPLGGAFGEAIDRKVWLGKDEAGPATLQASGAIGFEEIGPPGEVVNNTAAN